MTNTDDGETAQRELDRIVDRLRTMPLARLDDSAPIIREHLAKILYLNKQAHPADPTDLPLVGTHALPDQVRVIATDLLGTDQQPTLAALLTDMRRALP